MTSSAAPVYRFFRRASGPASSTRGLAVAMIVIACSCVALGVFRVQRRHEVLRLGYQLERQTERVAELRETRRRLELDLAALSAPERIRRLATELGMTQVSPDRIRVVHPSAAPFGGTAQSGGAGPVQAPQHDKVASAP
jgi:cell division protein FtsL